MSSRRWRVLLLTGMRLSPLLAAVLINTALLNLFLKEPRYHSEAHHRPLLVVRLEGPNMTSVEGKISNLTNRSFCIDYRTLKSWLHKDIEDTSDSSSLSHSSVNQKVSLSTRAIRDVQKFVFFIGYPRSGHSIVGSLMDAHPNMLIAHEYNLFRQWDKNPHKHLKREYLYNSLYRNSVQSSVSLRSTAKSLKGYTLGIDYRWQANFTRLAVIGDKSGAVTAQMFQSYHQRFMEILRQMKQTVEVPIRVIHVVRNPYDIISTRLLYADGERKSKLPATEERRHCNDYGLSYHANRTFSLVRSVGRFIDEANLTVLEVHHADLVRRPRKTVSMICRFLNLPCPDDYLEACEKKVYSEPPRTRLLVNWPDKMVEEVYQLAKPYRFLWRYSFQGD